MKVKFLKHHVHHKAGEEAEIPEDIAAYLIKCRVVTVENETPEETEKKLNKKLKAAKKK